MVESSSDNNKHLFYFTTENTTFQVFVVIEGLNVGAGCIKVLFQNRNILQADDLDGKAKNKNVLKFKVTRKTFHLYSNVFICVS